MKKATQSDLDTFFENAMNDTAIYPYLSMSKFSDKETAPESDWNCLMFVNIKLTCFLKIDFDRARELEVQIAIYSQNAYWAGKAMKVVDEIIRRYKPKAINSCVHSSNTKSIKIHNKIFGEPWGVQKNYAWNMGTGEYEDACYYRKLLNE